MWTPNSKTAVYLLFDERMLLHRPPSSIKEVDEGAYESPQFVHERPARAKAVYDALQNLERRLLLDQMALLHNDTNNTGDDIIIMPHFQRRFIPLPCQPASRETIELVHSSQHYENLLRTSWMTDAALTNLTLRSQDLYFCRDTFLAAKLACGGVVECVNAVTRGDFNNEESSELVVGQQHSTRAIAVVRPPGHHALRDEPMGFCYFNNIAVAAKHALHTHRAQRVFILDWDIHHGNGIQDICFDDPNIFYLSLHRGSFRANGSDYFYPGTGRTKETGIGAGVGTNLNIPFGKGGMGNLEYAAAFSEVVLPVMAEFDPDLVIIACGLDAAKGDLLGDCGLSAEMYHTMTRSVLETAGLDTPVVVALEGGYNLKVIAECMDAVALALLDEPFPGVPVPDPSIGLEALSIGLSKYWRKAMEEKCAENPVTKSALTSIKRSARALACSRSRLGAFNCIQHPNGYACQHHKHEYRFRRLTLLDTDRYPAKKRFLMRADDIFA